MKNKFNWGYAVVFLLGFGLAFGLNNEKSDAQNNPEIQRATMFPNIVGSESDIRDYNIESTSRYGRQFYILVDRQGNPIQMIAY